MNPEADPQGDGFQILQSLIAVGTGGVTGRGLMQGVQKLFYLPEPHTDFIYAVIGEEIGLVGTTLVLIAFVVITWRGLRIALPLPGSVRQLPGDGADRNDCRAGVHQHERRARAVADQGDPAALRQRGRLLAAHQPDRDGDPAEPVAARILCERR